MTKKEELNKLLNEYFGFEKLKDLQYKAIKKILAKEDVFALLPTSFGKSICYQIPYLYSKKNVIVVSPLISLMEDQMYDMRRRNIDAICLNSNNKNKTKELAEIYNGKACIIYTTPEYLILNKTLLSKLAEEDRLLLIAVDECHCVSSWGHSFREDYRNLSYLKDDVPNVPILAVTATATDKVVRDIIGNLKLKNPAIIKHSVDRDNLYIQMEQKNDTPLTVKKIITKLEEMKEGKALIYCKTTAETDELAEKINSSGIKCESYHAKKKMEDRNEIQKKYMDNEMKVIVSTIAFGMGINIPDIRLMIHYNCSNDVESYLQEIGRAGRDNKESECFMFYSSKDFALNYKFLEEIKDLDIRKYKEGNINYLKKIVTTDECRRKYLLSFFGEEKDECGKCDNCKKNGEKKNITKEALLLLEIIQIRRLGMVSYIKILYGSSDKSTEKIKNIFMDYHGKGNYLSQDNWKKVFNLLINKGYIKEEYVKQDKFSYSVNTITMKGLKWLHDYISGENKEELLYNIEYDNKKKKKNEEGDGEIEEAKHMLDYLMKTKNKK